MKVWIPFLLPAVVALFVVFVVFMVGISASSVSDDRNNEAYIAWCKLTGRTDITKEELLALKRRGLLNFYYKVDNQLNNK
jgi:hypothetical protein